jgi:NADH-quinone oxidoreductase subunit G
MIKRGGEWEETDWPTALEFVATELRRLRDAHGGNSIGALASPQATLEELHLLAKLTRGLGSENIDFRLRQLDFSGDGALRGAPWLGMPVSELNRLDRVLLVGSTLRKDHPLMAHRLRQAVKRGAELNVLNPVDDDLLMHVHGRLIVAPGAMTDALAQVVKAAAAIRGVAAPAAISGLRPGDAARGVAESLLTGEARAVLLGNLAEHHPQRAQLHALAQALAGIVGARLGFLGESANSVGGYLAGALPRRGGLDARGMLEQGCKAFLLLHTEIELDAANARRARAAMNAAEFVVALSPYRHRALEYAQALLPVAPFTETAGSFVSTEGRLQSFQGVVRPFGDTRPAWKVLRVLGNLLGIDGFSQESAESVRDELLAGIGDIAARLDNVIGLEAATPAVAAGGIERIGEFPIYHVDPIVRRAVSLQRTRDARAATAWLPGKLIEQLGLQQGDRLRVTQDGGEAVVGFARDDRLPRNCVRLPAGCRETAGIGAVFGEVELRRVPVRDKVTA